MIRLSSMRILALSLFLLLSPVAARYIISSGTANATPSISFSPTIGISDFRPPSNVSRPSTESPLNSTALTHQSSSETQPEHLLQPQLQKRVCQPDCNIETTRLFLVDSMDVFQRQLMLREPPELEWHVRGCPHLLTDRPLGFDFTQACERYNFGKWNYHPGGRNDSRIWKKIDIQFWEDLQLACGRSGDEMEKLGSVQNIEEIDLPVPPNAKNHDADSNADTDAESSTELATSDDESDEATSDDESDEATSDDEIDEATTSDDEIDEATLTSTTAATAQETRKKQCLFAAYVYLHIFLDEWKHMAEEEATAEAHKPIDVKLDKIDWRREPIHLEWLNFLGVQLRVKCLDVGGTCRRPMDV